VVNFNVSDAEIARYAEDGAVCLRGAIAADWIARLRAAIEADIAAPGPMKRENTPAGAPGLAFLDFQLWQRHPACRSFVLESPAGELAARLMGARDVTFYHDRLQVREPGTPELTQWHHDQPYYPLDGGQIVSFWLPLEATPREGGLEYVRGSHRWGRWFQPSFPRRDGPPPPEDPRFEPVPDIEGDRSRYTLLSWDLAPGDLVAYHGLTLHGTRRGAIAPSRRSVWETRWCSDEVRYASRIGPITPRLEGHGLAAGDRLGGAMFPRVWPRQAGASGASQAL